MERLQDRTDILNLIKNISESCDIKNCEITNVQTNQKGEGFLGEIYFVTVNDKITKKQLDLVIKAAFQDDKVREYVPIRESFENEIYAYSIVLPTFEKFLISKGLNINDDKYRFVPKCYQISIEKQSEVLILENLRLNDFVLFDKHSILDGEHIALMFETYGYFHGISLAYKDQYPNEYKQLTDQLKDMYSQFLIVENFENNLKRLIEIIERYFVNAQDDDILECFKKYTCDCGKLFRESFESNCPNSVILHGDCWSNNMMFKYNNSTRTPIDIRLIDLQLMKRGNPVCDLSYCLYSGASKEVFDKLDDYLSIYHRSLTDIVRKLGSNPDQLFTLENLKNDWKQYAKFGFLMSLLVIVVKLTKSDDLVDITDAAEDKDAFINAKFDEDEFCLRISDIVKHMYDYGAL